MAEQPEERIERTLARPLINAGVELRPGDTVMLRQDQIDRLEPDGYFEAPPSRRRNNRKESE